MTQNQGAITSTNTGTGMFAAIFGTYFFLLIIVVVVSLASLWKIYKKAGQKGWESVIPIYNIIVLLKIVELPIWYIALLFVPFVQIYIFFKIYIELAHKFGKTTAYGFGLALLGVVFLPMLAFGNNTYKSNSGSAFAANNSMNINPEMQQNYSPYQNPNMTQNMGQPLMPNGYSYPMPNNSPQQQQQDGGYTTVNNNIEGGFEDNNTEVFTGFDGDIAFNSNTNINPPLEPVGFNPGMVTMPQNNFSDVGTSVESQNVNTQTQVSPPIGPVMGTETATTPNNNVNVAKKTCPNCGSQIDANAGTCFMCGYKF